MSTIRTALSLGRIPQSITICIGKRNTQIVRDLWGQESALLLSEDGLDRDIKFSAATGVNPINFAMLHEYRVKVSALSEEMYTFYKSYTAYENANGNPFAEPVVLYSNMSNNMGCFGVSTTKRFYK